MMKWKKPEIQEINPKDIPLSIRIKLHVKRLWSKLWQHVQA